MQPAASSGAPFAYHRVGKVPGCDCRAHTNRLLEHEDPAIRRRRGNRFTVHPARFLREPLDEPGAVGDFAARLGERLALLDREQARKILGVLDDRVVPRFEELLRFAAAARAIAKTPPRGGNPRARLSRKVRTWPIVRRFRVSNRVVARPDPPGDMAIFDSVRRSVLAKDVPGRRVSLSWGRIRG